MATSVNNLVSEDSKVHSEKPQTDNHTLRKVASVAFLAIATLLACATIFCGVYLIPRCAYCTYACSMLAAATLTVALAAIGVALIPCCKPSTKPKEKAEKISSKETRFSLPEEDKQKTRKKFLHDTKDQTFENIIKIYEWDFFEQGILDKDARGEAKIEGNKYPGFNYYYTDCSLKDRFSHEMKDKSFEDIYQAFGHKGQFANLFKYGFLTPETIRSQVLSKFHIQGFELMFTLYDGWMLFEESVVSSQHEEVQSSFEEFQKTLAYPKFFQNNQAQLIQFGFLSSS